MEVRVIEQAPAQLVSNTYADVYIVTSISVVTTASVGSSSVPYFIVPNDEDPHVVGEEHPALVSAWDNDDDDVYDTL